MNQEQQEFSKRIAALTDVSLLLTNNLKEIKFGPDDLEKLKKINFPVIFATTHLSDLDTTAFLNVLAKETKIMVSVAYESSQESPLQNSVGWFNLSIAKLMVGKENFLPITSHQGKGVLAPKDYESQAEIIKNGRSIVMAGYHSRKIDKARGIRHIGHNQRGVTLPNKGGVGAVFLSILSGAPIVPVAIDIESDKFRPGISVKIGELISPKVSSDFSNWEKMTSEEKRFAIRELRHYSDMILKSQASMLPTEKRGRQSQDLLY
ncbi:MAG: hypothetical protein HN846_03980 [Candidatus Pacebacteria bacterium]|jgi:hypothetical protein|nr:hypothetical protein [Candidatus Paceibacterota bacterium]MBT3511658.1 hypothetical protein [Candidatus Paceibacterota bacterium]MBT4004493.1 hypothetical protein [Candidatus Paceibacterota bacterium]MBT4358825.1 hypothetical protein [Candidatus Paceibacterota bacterium]MBT4680649.1 hypothetical protein [Candidatus Paceibacterota bacterium]